jgi:hypothetical protein
VYNGAQWLHRCLDSLVYQTLGDIEVIAVDNCSDDSTMDIIDTYCEQFPKKVRGIRLDTFTAGPGAGRNVGLDQARGSYIAFIDADDYFAYDALAKMYEKAVSSYCDLVYVASYDVRGTSMKRTRCLKEGTKEEILVSGSMVFWNKLVHRDLLRQCGSVPEGMVFEDIAYCVGLVSYAKRIGYINEPLYYYVIREDSGVNTLEPSRVLCTIDAQRIALERCNPQYIDYFANSIALRNCNNIRDRWHFADSFINQIKEIEPYLRDNPVYQQDTRTRQRTQAYLRLTDEPMLERVYLNGFGEALSEAYIQDIAESSFWNGAEVIVLNEDNCNFRQLSVLSSAYDEGAFNFVAGYFAVKEIYDSGGIYLDRCIKIRNPFNRLRYYNAFFCFLSKTEFSDRIFGGLPAQQVFQHILDSYKQYDKYSMELSKRIRRVLTECYRVSLNGKTEFNKYDLVVLDPTVCVFEGKSSLHICDHDFSDYAKTKGYATFPEPILASYLDIYDDQNNARHKNDRQQIARLEKANLELKSELEKGERQLQRIKSSKSWKVTRPLRRMSEFIGRLDRSLKINRERFCKTNRNEKQNDRK